MHAHVLPILQLVLLPLCCTITYVWSVLLGHVEAGFPYISDTGTYPPESCLFGLLLALYALTTALMSLIRWQQVKSYYQGEWSPSMRRINAVSLVLGLIASLGVLIVANFQETNVIVVHYIGAACAFGVGTVFTWLQVYISYKARHLPGHRACLRHFRLVLSLTITASCGLTMVFGYIAGQKLGSNKDHLKWKPGFEGFKEHVISTALEWVMAFLSAIFFATFFPEFRQCTVAMPVEFKVAITEVKNGFNGEVNDGFNGEVNDGFNGEVNDGFNGEVKDRVNGEVHHSNETQNAPFTVTSGDITKL